LLWRLAWLFDIHQKLKHTTASKSKMGQSRPHDNQRQTEREREKKKENNHKGKGSGRGRERVQNSYSETTQKRRRKNKEKDRNYERGRLVFFAVQILKNALGSLLSYSLFFIAFSFFFPLRAFCVFASCVFSQLQSCLLAIRCL